MSGYETAHKKGGIGSGRGLSIYGKLLPCNELTIGILMARTTAQRQEQYRDRITATHKRIELILELETFEKLAQLMKTSSANSRIEYITGLIAREHDALQGNGSLLYNDLFPDKKTEPPQPLPGRERPDAPIILWRHETSRCHARTVRGGRCKNAKSLLVITWEDDGRLYEITTCKRHDTAYFTPHPGIFKLKK